MDWEGGKSSGDPRAGLSLPCARARGRACLVLSLIVLVWNLALAARDALVAPGVCAPAFRREESPAAGRAHGADGGGVSAAVPVGGRTGPLTVRQRFLLGRKVDVNKAGWEEISGLPGISDGVARAVVAKRDRSGPFMRPEDLLDVPGIKEKRLKKILPFLSEFHNN